ncbi:unnamed protein product [Ceratitis capitata]|uniref:(Mediterranean fruit fly) hypothetical protein n=1 Tax=Ceratitis capitata TaxID=7213 RepID=A0A811VC15_CERCA|nr:unnamed protein product [Ceratitis capitata]
MGDAVRSKPWLGLMGNISAIMATCAAFGLAMYCGIEFIGINLAAPFLMIGIGIDDTFVMLAGWRRTPAKMPVAERMGHMMSEAAVSITITSLTDLFSFWIGIISPFRSVQIFCTYSVFAVVFTFIWHITFFAACMAISGYRERHNLHAIFGCKVQAMSVAIKEKRNFLYKAIMAGGINRDDPDNPIDNKDHMFMAFFKDHLAAVINNKWCKMLIILIFATYLAGACYGLTQIKEGLERRKLSKADSYSVEFFDREDEFYREFPYRMQVIITGDLNYSDPIVQDQIEELTRTLENTSYVTSSLYTESWIRSFRSFVARNNDYLNLTIDDEQSFIDAVKEHWLFPGNPFSLDVKFNEDETRIIASRFLIQAVNITDTNHEKRWCAICVRFLGVAGYMALWDVNLDSISMINLIMCIGFSVDFTAHICYTYMSSKKRSPKARVREALHSLGLPIVQGSSSTILGIIALLLAQSYIFLVFFKMVFLVIFFGAMHGLFLLPVLLSLFGPGSWQTWSGTDIGDDNDEITDVESPMKLSSMDKLNSYYLQQHTPLGLPGPFGTGKSFLGAPYKAYGDEKDLGIGTSGEDSSESSSSRSQRRQALEDEHTRRRYEEGWRRSSYHNLYNSNSQSQFQPNTDLYGQQVTAQEWRARLDVEQAERKRSAVGLRAYDNFAADFMHMQQRQAAAHNEDVVDASPVARIDTGRYTPTSSLDERARRKYRSSLTATAATHSAGSGDDSSYHQQMNAAPATTTTSVKRYHRRRSSEDSTRHYQRWPPSNIEERCARRYASAARDDSAAYVPTHANAAAAASAYRPHPPVRSSSHHNLYYPNGAQHPPTYQYGGCYYK